MKVDTRLISHPKSFIPDSPAVVRQVVPESNGLRITYLVIRILKLTPWMEQNFSLFSPCSTQRIFTPFYEFSSLINTVANVSIYPVKIKGSFLLLFFHLIKTRRVDI